MKAKRIGTWIVGGVLCALTLFGGTVAAGDYPPSDTTVTTVAAGGISGFGDRAVGSTDALAATGSSNDTTLKLAGGTLVAGAGLLVASRRRQRPVAT